MSYSFEEEITINAEKALNRKIDEALEAIGFLVSDCMNIEVEKVMGSVDVGGIQNIQSEMRGLKRALKHELKDQAYINFRSKIIEKTLKILEEEHIDEISHTESQ